MMRNKIMQARSAAVTLSSKIRSGLSPPSGSFQAGSAELRQLTRRLPGPIKTRSTAPVGPRVLALLLTTLFLQNANASGNLKTGYISKRGKSYWYKRWFTLSDEFVLAYHKKDNHADKIGEMKLYFPNEVERLRPDIVITDRNDDSRKREIIITPAEEGKPFRMYFGESYTTKDELEEWTRLLKSVIDGTHDLINKINAPLPVKFKPVLGRIGSDNVFVNDRVCVKEDYRTKYPEMGKNGYAATIVGRSKLNYYIDFGPIRLVPDYHLQFLARAEDCSPLQHDQEVIDTPGSTDDSNHAQADECNEEPDNKSGASKQDSQTGPKLRGMLVTKTWTTETTKLFAAETDRDISRDVEAYYLNGTYLEITSYEESTALDDNVNRQEFIFKLILERYNVEDIKIRNVLAYYDERDDVQKNSEKEWEEYLSDYSEDEVDIRSSRRRRLTPFTRLAEKLGLQC